MKFGIIISEFNSEITQALLESCLKGFKEQGIIADLVKVPGAVEIPLALKVYIENHKPDAVVALGAVIKGETDHYAQVCQMCSQGIMDVMLNKNTPVIFEVLMTETSALARARIQKAYEAAYTAVRMAKFMRNASQPISSNDESETDMLAN